MGLVTGTCFASAGVEVIGVDVDPAKLARLQQGDCPIYEPGLQSLMQEAIAASRLQFTGDAAAAIGAAEILFIAVGTPPDEDGHADLQVVLAVARTIGRHMDAPRIVVTKSTVPVGTTGKVAEAIRAEHQARGVTIPFEVVSNPEFLKEGSAELTKVAANAMLATKISFMNELANLAERLDGSCFPKDVQALVRTAQQAGYVPELLQAVEAVNQFQKQRLHRLVSQHFGGGAGLTGRRFAVGGLAYGPTTCA